MACLAGPIALESRAVGQRTMNPSYTTRRSRRALFGGFAGGSDSVENAVEDENERAQMSAFDADDGSEHGGSESEFEPSDLSESDSSGSEDGVYETIDVGRKRKRGTSKTDRIRAAPGSCRLCGHAYASPLDAHAHDAIPHTFVCDIEGCGCSFADEALAIQHIHEWHDVRHSERYVCSTCDSFFLTRHDLLLHHEQTNHKHEDPPKTLFVCNAVATCRQAYKKKDKLAPHTRRYHRANDDGSLFECDRCDLEFGTRHERQRHRETVHPGRTASPPSPSFVCELEGCGKSYSKKEHLTRHVRTTHDAPPEKPFGCDLCGVRFVYKHALTRHHTNCHTIDVDKPYACAVCLLAFKKKSLLQAHAFVHTGVLPFECEDCGQRFLKKFQLTRHARKHASAKPSQTQVFMCDHDDCGELLFSIQEKHAHLRDAHGVDSTKKVDPGEKKKRGKGRELRCLVCDQVFQRIQNLRSHLRTHFEALDARKLHECPMDACDKAYTKKSNLMAHYNAVHDPVKSRRFQCPYKGCNGAFGYKKVLQTHIASIHEKTLTVKKEIEEDEELDSEWDSEEEVDSEIRGKRRLKNQKKIKKRKGHEAVGVLTRVLGLDESVAKSKLEPATTRS